MLRYKGRFKSEQAVSVYEHFRQGLCFCCKVNPLFCKYNLSFFLSLKDSEMFVLFYFWKESIKDELCFKFYLFISHCDVTEM